MTAESILSEADRVTDLEKWAEYGCPKDNFENISSLWNAYINNKYKYVFASKYGIELEPKDVSMMMILFKICREQFAHKRDNLVDIAGYTKMAAILENIE